MNYFEFTARRKDIISILIFNFIFFSTILINAAPGNIDRSFGIDGTVKTIFPSSNQKLTSTFQPDGKLLVVGQGGSAPFYDFYISRFNTDGSFDTGFGTNGTAVIQVSTLLDVATRAAIQPDGKIVIAGYAQSNLTSSIDIAVVRLNSNGTLDSTFHNDGIVTTSASQGSDFAYDVIIQPDGKIVVFGISNIINGVQTMTIVRYTPNGSPDVTFSLDGISTVQFPGGSSSIAVKGLIQSNGRLIAAGSVSNSSSTTFGLARFGPDGSIDISFGNAGTVAVDVRNSTARYNTITDILQQPDGKIVAVGLTDGGLDNNFDFAAARLNLNGTIDTSFGNDGKVITAIPGGGNDSASTVIRQNDGKLLIGGIGNADFTLIRLNPDGTYDTRFGNNGVAITIDPSYGQGISSLRILEDGKIAAAGFSNFETAFVRYLVNGSREADFDGDKKSDVSIFRPSNGSWWYQRSSNDQGFSVQFGSASDKIVPADFTGDGKTDIAFFRETSNEWFVLRSEDNTFYAFPFGSTGDKAVPADFDGDGKADPTVFRPSNAGWYSILSSNGNVLSRSFGVSEDVPLPNDYDGDGKADLGIFRPSTNVWWIQRSGNDSSLSVRFGATGDKPTPADFTGDGKTDIAFFRPSNATWYILRSEEENSFYGFPFGAGEDTPAAGDYDGDGKADAAMFRDSNASWYLLRSTAGFVGLQFGLSGDKPVPSAFVP